MIAKAILGFPFGLAVGFMFYFCVIDRLKLSAFLRFLLGSVVTLVMSMGYARSIKIRCIVWLIFPCFFGKSGRGILMTMAIGALLTGPISNTMDNFKESVRTVTCMTELMINITIKRFELTGKPIFNIVRGFVVIPLRRAAFILLVLVQNIFTGFNKDWFWSVIYPKKPINSLFFSKRI